MSASERNRIAYIEHLISFKNYSAAVRMIDNLIITSKAKEIKVAAGILRNKIAYKKNKHYSHNGVVVLADDFGKHPVVFHLSMEYLRRPNASYVPEIEAIVRRAASTVEEYFAKRNILVDINPGKCKIEDFEKLMPYNLKCRSLELSLALMMIGESAEQEPSGPYVASGGIGPGGVLEKTEMVDDKMSAILPEMPNSKIIFAGEDFKTGMNVLFVNSFDEAVSAVYPGLKGKSKIKKDFLGNPEEMLSIAEMYFQRDDPSVYLQIYLNLNRILDKDKTARGKNILFTSLMRTAMHYNHTGELEKANEYFKKSYELKKKLKKDDIFEMNRSTIEFNNVYAVFLKDIYRMKEGVKLLEESTLEKKECGKQVKLTTQGTLAQYLTSAKKYSQAERILLKCIETEKESVPADLPRTYCYLAKNETLRGSIGKAKEYLKEAEKHSSDSSPCSQKIFISYENIRTMCAAGQIKAAEKELKHLLSIVEGTKYEYMEIFALELIASALAQKDLKKARKYAVKAYSMAKYAEKEDMVIIALRAFANIALLGRDSGFENIIIDELNFLKFLKGNFKETVDTIKKNKRKGISKFIDSVNVV